MPPRPLIAALVPVALAVATCLAAPATSAQTADSGNAAVNPSGTVALVPMGSLAKGQNSFTQGQAQSRLEDAGLTGVTGLALDGDGIWRGKAVRGGKPVSIGFDFKGQMAAE